MTRHVNRDSGCRSAATVHLRPYLKSHRYALVVFDRHGCGSQGPRVEIQREVERDLARNGWKDRSKVIVIDPEIEVWVWSGSPEVARVLGWGSDLRALRKWLESRNLWASNRSKPRHPKNAMRHAMAGAPENKARRRSKARRSPSKFYDLATMVDFAGCRDPAFIELTRTLRGWFPPVAAR